MPWAEVKIAVDGAARKVEARVWQGLRIEHGERGLEHIGIRGYTGAG